VPSTLFASESRSLHRYFRAIRAMVQPRSGIRQCSPLFARFRGLVTIQATKFLRHCDSHQRRWFPTASAAIARCVFSASTKIRRACAQARGNAAAWAPQSIVVSTCEMNPQQFPDRDSTPRHSARPPLFIASLDLRHRISCRFR